MSKIRRWFLTLFPACAMGVLILDSKTALQGAAAGIELCIHSVIPSLFPFFMLSILLTNAILVGADQKAPGRRRPGILLFLAGLLGGYPTGAQLVTQAYRNGNLSKNAARRMLGFCSNAGPSFIFGFAGQLFTKPYIPWILWLIHILSAMLLAAVIPGTTSEESLCPQQDTITVHHAFTKSLYAIACVCGWIILFRVLIVFCDKWFLWLLPEPAAVLITGILELTNGIFQLQNIGSEATRFILCSVLLAFGGSCVIMQTVSVTEALGLGWYFPGKIAQSMISGVLSGIAAHWIYGSAGIARLLPLFVITITFFCILIASRPKFTVDFYRSWVYNRQKS